MITSLHYVKLQVSDYEHDKLHHYIPLMYYLEGMVNDFSDKYKFLQIFNFAGIYLLKITS